MDNRHRVVCARDEVVSLEGPLDAASAPAVRERLHRALAPGVRLVVDLSGVGFIDSAGLWALVSAFKRARAVTGDVVLCGVSPAVRSVLELTNLDRVLDVFGDRQAALSHASR